MDNESDLSQREHYRHAGLSSSQSHSWKRRGSGSEKNSKLTRVPVKIAEVSQSTAEFAIDNRYTVRGAEESGSSLESSRLLIRFDDYRLVAGRDLRTPRDDGLSQADKRAVPSQI